jgi:chromate reductase, NAD(P)H dehydrogenase (quinone)
MTATCTVAVIVGSLRKDSLNRKVARAAIALAPDQLSLELVEIRDLPVYNQDLETEAPPAAWTAFRARMAAVDAALLVTPEYNRGLTGAMKNAIDVGSRPHGESIWKSLPIAIASASPGKLGGFGASQQLRQSMATLGAPTLPAPEMYLGGIDKRFDDAGQLTDASTRDFLRKFLDAFAVWIERNARRQE